MNKIQKDNLKLTIDKMAEAADQLYELDLYTECIMLFLSLERLCTSHNIEMPDTAVSLNIELDDTFNTDITTFSYVPQIIGQLIERH